MAGPFDLSFLDKSSSLFGETGLGNVRGSLLRGSPTLGGALGGNIGGAAAGGSGGFLQGLIGAGSKAAGLATPAGLAIGGTQLLGSLIQGAKGRRETPGEADPGQLALLEQLKQRARSAESGAEFATEKALVQQTGAATRGAISRASGGSANETINALLRSQGAQNTSLNKLIAGSAGRERFFTGLGVNLQNQVSQRRFDTQMFGALERKAQSAQLGKEGFANVLGALFTKPQTT